MPRPKARWRLLLAVDHELVGPVEGLGVAVGGREGEQHPVAGGHGAAADLGVGSMMRAMVTGA
jgi:hypothetical protein